MEQQQLKRLLGRGFSIAACIGVIIGLGILRTPGEIARSVQDPWVYMALWLGGGLFVLMSVLVVAELISITPRSGGPYAMIANAYGPYPGFLIGWTDWLSLCASSALKAVVLMEYAALLLPELKPFLVAGALAISSLFALIQLGGLRLGGAIHQFAAAVFALILLSVTVALLLGRGGAGSEPVISGAAGGWAGYGIVAAAIVFTYDGWVSASYFSAEIEGGGRAAAIGSIKAVLIVIALYLLLNGALVFSVPLAALDGHDFALAGALEYLFGAGAGTFIVLAALFILLAHQNIHYMTASRALYALSVDDLGSRQATRVSKRGTPTGAVVFTWLMMVALILAGGFEFLLNMAAVLFIGMYLALMVGVLRLRRIRPALERPFRAWGYPFIPWLCILGWAGIAAFVGLMDPQSLLCSLLLVALSVPAYLWLRSRRGGQPLQKPLSP
ncbi:MAG: APC family permease [Xanthomonadales bacterium]|nr:APC family permease [Xanthomonadales bacterium]